MDWWKAPKLWPNQTVYIIGGGPSLKGFTDWDLLHDKRVIGNNDAYKLGEEVVDVCNFGDDAWFNHHREGLLDFGGMIVTCCVEAMECEGMCVMRKEVTNLGIWTTPGEIGWNTNTGGMAVNLAVLFGATKIILLGFDMHLDEETGENNWHPNPLDDPNPDVFNKHLIAFGHIEKDLREKYPEVEVINATPGSAMKYFPIVKMEDVL